MEVAGSLTQPGGRVLTRFIDTRQLPSRPGPRGSTPRRFVGLGGGYKKLATVSTAQHSSTRSRRRNEARRRRHAARARAGGGAAGAPPAGAYSTHGS